MRALLLLLLFYLPVIPAAESPVILVLGDSLSAAYGMDTELGWVRLLEQRLQTTGRPFRVVNASISGDTTRGALARVDDALHAHRPAIVIIGLGGNDGLRGISLQEIKKNLAELVATSQRHGARVLLLGMRLPPNYGKFYADRFHQLYLEVADETQASLVPFFLESVADDLSLMQDDRIHPSVAAQMLLLDTVWPYLEPLLSNTGSTISAPASVPAEPGG
jgi:acyl-CoA thioesterase-1